MIKSKAVASVVPHAYPRLMISKEDKVILIQSSSSEGRDIFSGVVVGGGNPKTFDDDYAYEYDELGSYKIGHYSECWTTESFVPYLGTVTLSN